jgi:Tol biopolymer transport system component
MMDAEGLNPVQFTSSGAINNTEPIWYQEKDLVLFTQQLGLGSPSRQVFGMRLEDIGKDEEYPLIEGHYQNYIPLSDHVGVSPNGTWLAFDFWYHDVLSDIYIMTFPGTNLQQLTDFAGEDYDPVWRP